MKYLDEPLFQSDQIETYWRDGYLVVKRLIAEKQLDTFNSRFEAIIKNMGAGFGLGFGVVTDTQLSPMRRDDRGCWDMKDVMIIKGAFKFQCNQI